MSAADQATALQRQMYQDTTANLSPYLQAGTRGQANLNYLLGIDPGGETQSSGEVANNIGAYKGQLLSPYQAFQAPDAFNFQASPAYQYNLQQGEAAINKASAARGGYYNTQTLKDLGQFTQGRASNEYQNAFANYGQDYNRALSTYGTNANNYYTGLNNIYSRLQNLGATGQNAAVQQGGFGQNAANNISNNMIGAGNAQASGIVGGANAISGGIQGGMNNYYTQQLLSNMQNNQKSMYGGGGYGGGVGSTNDYLNAGVLPE